ncbi:unnamed protein product [Cochlearia groenlandica]
MEFRYRAIDGDRPPPSLTQPPNPIFSRRPIPPGRSEDDDDDLLREAIQREIEKEQIRNEIILAETSRRRELFAEVIHEMAIEREMALRRVSETRLSLSLEDKLTMLINQRKLLTTNHDYNNNNNDDDLFTQKCTYNDSLRYTWPHSLATSPMKQSPSLHQISEATPVLESNKEKLIVLTRPDSIGPKRKAEDTPRTDVKRPKRKADGVSLSKESPHSLVGLENKAKETALSPNQVSLETGETMPSKLPLCSGNKQKLKANFKFWCELCGVGTYCETVMKDHELGKKHSLAVKKQNKGLQTVSTSSSSSINITPTQQEGVTVLHEKANDVEDQQKVDGETDGEKTKKVEFWCEVCKIRTPSMGVMETHKLGKKHKALAENKPQACLGSGEISK